MKARILPVLGVTFAALLLSRAAAMSSEVGLEQAPPIEKASTETMPPSAEEEAMPSTQCLSGVVLETVTADMARLKLRNKEISERKSALNAIEKKLETKIKAIETANLALQNNIDSLKSVANEDLTHLVGMYQTMKPKQAADIFNSMDPSFAAGFLREMSSDKAGLIMANMDTRKSYAISVIIAGRNSKYRASKS